jgi:DNA-binding response OmpR family regulator
MPKLALVVDAEPALCEILHRALRPADIEDLILTSNAEAAGHLLATRFDLVFVDLRGSPIQGVELTGRIRQSGLNRTTPVILISGDQSKGELSRGFGAGASFFVHMPIDVGRLAKLIVNITAIEQRRRFRRVSEHIRVQLASAHLQIEGETIDLSLGGMLVRVPRTFPLGTLVELSLFLPSTVKPIVGLGSVTRANGGNEMGIQIDRLTIEQSTRLQEYLLHLVA